MVEALLLNDRYQLHAGIDASDGLAVDLSHVANESGCGALVRLDAVPGQRGRPASGRRGSDGITPLEHALGDGEDFELILAVPPDEGRRMLDEQPLETPLSCIGQFIAEPGLWQAVGGGPPTPLATRGWQHRFD